MGLELQPDSVLEPPVSHADCEKLTEELACLTEVVVGLAEAVTLAV